MARRGYMPGPDAEFDEWLRNFNTKLPDIADAVGLSDDFVNQVLSAMLGWGMAYKAHQEAQNTALAATETKNESRVTAHEVIRPIVQMLQTNPKLTDAQREILGITVPDRIRTPTSPEYVKELPAPLLDLDWSQRGQVIVHFGVNPSNEKENAKPEEIGGAKIWYRILNPKVAAPGPPPASEWMWAGDDTNSPYVHKLDITEVKEVEYRAQWFDKRMRVGPFSETYKAAVTVST